MRRDYQFNQYSYQTFIFGISETISRFGKQTTFQHSLPIVFVIVPLVIAMWPVVEGAFHIIGRPDEEQTTNCCAVFDNQCCPLMFTSGHHSATINDIL